MGVKSSHLFEWEHEPVDERPSTFFATGYGTLSGSQSRFGVDAARTAAKAPVRVDWATQRDPATPSDKTLTPVARGWADQFPPELRPTQLCALYPRIANRLALCWPDKALTARVFDNLSSTKRSGRKGFPPAVAAELTALRKQSLVMGLV